MNQQAYNPLQGMTSGDQSFGARRPYLEDGDYNLEIERCVIRGRGEPNYIVEVTVLESNVPDRPPGTQCVVFIDMNNADTRGKHLCAFVSAAYGVDPMTLPKDSQVTPWDNQPWSGWVMYAASEQNPFGRRRIFANVQTIFTKAQTPWTLNTFSPYGMKQIGPRVFGPAYGVAKAQPQQQQPAAPAGGFAQPGFQAPGQQPGAAPAGFAAPMPPQGGAPLGGFAPPGGAQPVAPGAPPAGWGPTPAAPVPQAPQQPQQGYQPQYQQPYQPQQQPQQAPQQPPQYVAPAPPQPQYQQQPQQQYPAAPQQPQPQYQQQPQQQYPAAPQYAPAPGYAAPAPAPGYTPAPAGPQFGGPWGGGGGPAR